MSWHNDPASPLTRIFLACGATDMRKGFDGLAVLVQQVLDQSPHSGALFAFRGKRGDLVKLLWYDGQGLCLFSKRMDRGRFIWPSTATGTVAMTAAQLSMLLEGIDWRRPERTFTPPLAGQKRPDSGAFSRSADCDMLYIRGVGRRPFRP